MPRRTLVLVFVILVTSISFTLAILLVSAKRPPVLILGLAGAALVLAGLWIYLRLRAPNTIGSGAPEKILRLIFIYSGVGIVAAIRALERGWGLDDTIGLTILISILTGLAIVYRRRQNAPPEQPRL
jgi:hypothetical protein